MNREILTVRELAAYLRMAEITVYKHLRAKKIPGFRVGAAWRFRRSRIEAWLKEKEEFLATWG